MSRRELILDTETTGLDPNAGHRVVEIGCIELVNLIPTGRVYHQYINPERSMPQEAYNVHGLSIDFLSKHPTFKEVANDFIEFVGADSHLVIHNASFDMKFLDWELSQLELNLISRERVIDTLAIARKQHPGARNSLDALCRRYSVNNKHREYHGALLDSELLAEVYLHLKGGKQPGFALVPKTKVTRETETIEQFEMKRRYYPISDSEQAQHNQLINKLKNAKWHLHY